MKIATSVLAIISGLACAVGFVVPPKNYGLARAHVGTLVPLSDLPTSAAGRMRGARGQAQPIGRRFASSTPPPASEPPRDKDLEFLVGVVGTLTSLVVFWSEFTLKTTGCGLPAGPLGLIGLTEGLSYIAVVCCIAWSLFTKATTGSGLPAGKYGLLGAAEGLSFLAVGAGLVVLGFQINDYGFIPEAVPVEGGRCSA